MAKAPDPVVLELATLSREQIGPYLLLGLDKSADKEQIDKNWADRVRWALRQPPQIKVPREDVNWAHEILKEIDKRIRSDVSSLNTDTADGVVTQLSNRYGASAGQAGRVWQPLDNEKQLADYKPPADVPIAADVRAALVVPETPEETPFAALLLERLARLDLDPWAVELPPAGPHAMNDDFSPGFPGADSPAPPRDDHTLGASTIFKLCAEIIQLRERNDRTHRDFERTLAKTRDELKSGFDNFAAATQRAYQDLRKETVGEKKVSMDLLMLLLEISQDLEHITAVKPPPDDAEAVKRWIEAVEVETRKVQALIAQKNIKEHEARPGEPYDPKWHKRVGTERVEGMGPNLIARTVKKGYASQQPDFVLQRPDVIVSE